MFRQAAAILDWAEDRYDQPISESDIQQVAAMENWVDIANFNMQLHGDLVSLMEECTEGSEIVRNTKTEVELTHGEDCITSMILVTHCETYSCWRGCSRRRKLATQTWLQAWRDSSKGCEWFVRDLEMDSHGGLEVTIRQTESKKKLPNNFVKQTPECS